MSDIERALHALGTRLADEPAPDLACAIAVRLDRPPKVARGTGRRRRRTLVIALATLLLAAASAFAASPSLRAYARSWLRSVGISTSAPDHPTSAPLVGLDRAGLGPPIGAAAAASRLGLKTLPQPFGPPARVFASGNAVTLVWPPGPDRPPSAVRGVGALLTIAASPGQSDPSFLAKALSRATTVEFADLAKADAGQAVWIAGAPHAVKTFDGTVVRFRLATNVLVWRVGPLVYRLEGNVSRDAALAVARRSMG